MYGGGAGEGEGEFSWESTGQSRFVRKKNLSFRVRKAISFPTLTHLGCNHCHPNLCASKTRRVRGCTQFGHRCPRLQCNSLEQSHREKRKELPGKNKLEVSQCPLVFCMTQQWQTGGPS